jgi:L-malate glycosyltransferase
LLKLNSNSELWLFGDGPLKNQIEFQVDVLNIKQKVKFKGLAANPWEFIPTNAIFLLPSKIEGLPAVILEAMYLGIPVVAHDVGGIGGVVKNGKTGWLVPKGDKNAFVKSVQEVLTAEEDQLKQITEQARQLVLEQYTLEKVAGEFEKVYFEVIRRK